MFRNVPSVQRTPMLLWAGRVHRRGTALILVLLMTVTLAALVPELPELVDSHEVGVDGRGVLRAYMLAVEPDLVALNGLLTASPPGVSVAVLRPLLPVISQLDRKSQLFDTMTRWREIAAREDLPLWEIAVQYEICLLY